MSEVEQSVPGGQQGVDVSRPDGSKTKRILLVEEEPLLGVAILNNLRRVGFAVDVASNGTIALEKLRSSAPDAIFLDLMLPNIDSVEVISEARREPEYADLPIYVYTSAFPMKMSRRAAKAGATQIFDKISTPLDEVAAEVASQLIGSSAAAADSIQSDPAESEAIKEITAKLPECVGRIHRHLQELVRCKNTATRATKYGELRSRVHLVVNYAILSARYDMARLAATLQSLLNVLREKPRYAADSGVRTISFAVEVLGLLCASNAVGQSSQLAEFTAVLVDDELTSRSVVCSALRSTGFNLNGFADPIRALKHLQSHSADLVVLKAVMRETNGFDLCKKLRLLPAHKKTPVIFVGDPKDFENHARAASCGPNDSITRPFIFMELSLKAISLVLKNRLSIRVGATGGAAVAPQAKRPDAGPPEQRTIGAVPARQPAETTTRVQESNTALYRANGELKKQLQAVSAEAATLRQTLEKKQKEREELSARPLSGGTELDRVRTALEQERQQRQRLEKKLQEMAAPQLLMSREQSVDDLPGRFTAPTRTGVGDSNTPQSRANEELKQQLQAMSAETATLREALEKKQKEREELAGRIFADGVELEQIRTALEQERQQRQQLETNLQEMTAKQAEPQQQVAELVETESPEQWNATEAARLEEGPRSIRFEEELTSSQQQRDELSSQLALAQQAAADSQQHSTGLETRLWETTEELDRARIELEQERAQRQQLETSLQEMTANQAGLEQRLVETEPVETELREQWNATEAARREEGPRSIRFEEELTSSQQPHDELSNQLALAQQAAAESQQHGTGLETRLRETTEELDRARIELEQERAQRQQLETSLQEMTANPAGLEQRVVGMQPVETESREQWNATEAARLEEDPPCTRFQEELTSPQQQHDELSSQLALAQQAAAEAQQHSTASEARLQEMTEELDRAKTGLEQQAAERARLESELGGQLKAAKAAAEKAQGACWEEAKRSKGFEEQLCNLQRERDELSGKLTVKQKAIEEFKRRTEELENGLRKGNEQLEHTKSELEKQAADRARLESGLGGQLKAAKAAAEKAEGACREEAQRSKRFEGEWASLQQQREELSGKLAAEQQAARESKRRTEELEKQLRERNQQLEHAKTGLEQQAADRARLESELGEQLEVAKAAVQRAEAACRQKPSGAGERSNSSPG